MSGFAVIDLETTGFAYNGTDPTCEIGVVLLDANGEREATYGTLVNPQRDLGAQHIHGIDATAACVVGLEGADEYLELLDRVLLDRKISVPARWTGSQSNSR